MLDGVDNCLGGVQNPTQSDVDGDGFGDACDPDADNDGRFNDPRFAAPPDLDQFPFDTDNDGVNNSADADDDGDGDADTADNCRLYPNANQLNTDSEGDVCDADDDGDQFADRAEQYAGSSLINAASKPEFLGLGTTCSDALDNDGDGTRDMGDAGCVDGDNDRVPNATDNCPTTINPDQTDRDADGIGDSCDATPLPANSRPTVAINSQTYSVDEGSTLVVKATGNDPETQPLIYTWDLNHDGTFGAASQTITMTTNELDGPGLQLIAVQVTDSGELTATATTVVTIRNVAPQLGAPRITPDALNGNALITVSAAFTDAGKLDTHTALINWGDGSTTALQPTTVYGRGIVQAPPTATTTIMPPTSTSVPPTPTPTTTATPLPPTATATKVPPTATLTNTPVNPFVAMGSAALTVHENTGSVAVIVKLNTPVAQSVTVNYVLTAAAAAAGPKRSLVSRIINRIRGM